MITPTSLAPRIAPILFNDNRNHGTSNSVSTISAILSASVSTNPNSLSPTKLIKRYDTAL